MQREETTWPVVLFTVPIPEDSGPSSSHVSGSTQDTLEKQQLAMQAPAASLQMQRLAVK